MNDPLVRLLGAEERIVPRPAYRAALRQRLLTFAPAPGLPIDAPLLGRVIVRPVHVLVIALVGVAAVAGALALRPAGREPVVQPASAGQPASPPRDALAPAAAPALGRPVPNSAERRAAIAARIAADRPSGRSVATSATAAPGDGAFVSPAAAPRQPSRPAGIAADVAATPDVPAPAGAGNVAPPHDPSADRGRDRGRPAASPSATATAAAPEPAGGADATSPAILPPEPAEPTQAPPPAMPTVPVAPTPAPGP